MTIAVDLGLKATKQTKTNLTPLDMYNPMFIVSNQKEESINIQRVKLRVVGIILLQSVR